MRRRRSRKGGPAPGRIRKYMLPKPEEFRTVAQALTKSSDISSEDFFIVSMMIDELEKAAEQVRSGEGYWKALLDWAMGVVRFERRAGVRKLQKIFDIISEVYGKR